VSGAEQQPGKKRGGFPFRKKAPAEPPPETPEAREAREAAERAAAEDAARLNAIGEAWAQRGDKIRAAFPTVDEPRQAYYLSLLRQGREAEEQGRVGVANHCRDLIRRGLEAFAAAQTARAAEASANASSAAADSSSPSRDLAPQGKPAAPVTPLTALRSKWEAASRDRAAALLERHAQRLAPAEREAYLASLESLSAPAASGPAGVSAQPLRRKLVERLLRAATYRRRAASFSGWKSAPVPSNGPAGPYNDFVALEQTVQRLAQQQPEWAAEFLDLYEGMGKIRSAYNALLPAGKKN